MKQRSLKRKTLFLVITATLLSTFLPARAAEKEVVNMNFDDCIPGSWPPKWGKGWGCIDDANSVYVTNIDSISNKNSLLIMGGPKSLKSQMFAFGTSHADIKDGWAVYNFCIKLVGSGNELRSFGFRILGRCEKSKSTKIIGAPVSFAGKRVRFKKKTIGTWESDVWYRITLWLPTRGASRSKHTLFWKSKTLTLAGHR